MSDVQSNFSNFFTQYDRPNVPCNNSSSLMNSVSKCITNKDA